MLAFFDRPNVLAQHVRPVPRRQPYPPFGNTLFSSARYHAGAQRMTGEVPRIKAGGRAARLDDAGYAAVCEPRGADPAALADGPEELGGLDDATGFIV